MAETFAGPGDAPGPRSNTQPADPVARPTDPLTELRTLILAPEQRQLEELRAHVFDSSVQTREISRLLPDALALRANDPDLARAIAPSVEEAITASVARDPQPLADALFPVMGPAIRKAIEHMLSAMMESFNRSVEQSLSWRALQWRLTAWRTGRPYAEIVLLDTLQYRVEQLFLIHAESGLLLQHVSADPSAGHDGDQVSAMLTAIRDFARDSFRVGAHDGLDTFRVGELTIFVEQSPYAILAAVVRGTPPSALRDTFTHALESIHRQLGAEMKTFAGDAAPFARARPILERCLVTQLRDDKRPRRFWKWAIAGGLALIALGIWTGLMLRERQRWNNYLARLRSEPGVVVLSSGRQGGRFFVSGLRDPLAVDPASLLPASQLAAGSVDQSWEPYQGFHPAFVIARARDLLYPPAGVTLDYRDGVLSASGTVSTRWLIESERLAPALAGVRRFAYTGEAADRQLKAQLEKSAVLFPKGQAMLAPEEIEKAPDIAALLAQLNDLLGHRQQRAEVEVLGHTDSDGSDLANEPLSRARAEVVLRLLRPAGFDALTFMARGVGSTAPFAAGATEAEKVLNRRASFRVSLPEDSGAGGRQ